MTFFDQFLDRPGAAADLPEQLVDTVIDGIRRQSIAMKTFRQVQALTYSNRVPVLEALPDAYWVSPSDTGLIKTTKAQFGNQTMTVEELATIAVIPNTVLEDSNIDIWGRVQPILSESLAKKLDDAVVWGVDRPSTFQPSLLEYAAAAGAVVSEGTDDDPVERVLAAARVVSAQGYPPTAAVVRPGWQYEAAAIRAQALVNNPGGSADAYPLLLAGLPIATDPLDWDLLHARSLVMRQDLCLLGIRRSITMLPSREGVITDDSGVVIHNLYQEDLTAVRLTMRVGNFIAAPPTYVDPLSLGLGLSARSPVVFVVPASRTDTGAGTTSGSATVTDTSALASDVGSTITGTGIPADTFVTAATTGTGFTISANATATGTTDVILTQVS